VLCHAQVTVSAEHKRAEFATAMLSEQDVFGKSLEKLERVVNNFSKRATPARARARRGAAPASLSAPRVAPLQRAPDVVTGCREQVHRPQQGEGRVRRGKARAGRAQGGREQEAAVQQARGHLRQGPSLEHPPARPATAPSPHAPLHSASLWSSVLVRLPSHRAGKDLTDYSQLARVVKAFEPFANLWTTAAKWVGWQHDWLHGVFNQLDPEAMDTNLQNSQRTMYKLVKTFDTTPGLGEISKKIKSEIEEFMPVMPLVTALRNPGMRERHWEQLSKELDKDMTQCAEDGFTLDKLNRMHLQEKIEPVSKVCDVAGKEFAIEQAMDKMEGEWKSVSLEVVLYRTTGTFVLKGADVIQQTLDDHIVMTQSMSFSPFKGHVT
jgi:hypothetical protein